MLLLGNTFILPDCSKTNILFVPSTELCISTGKLNDKFGKAFWYEISWLKEIKGMTNKSKIT